MTALQRILAVVALTLVSALAPAADKLPDQAIGKIDGLYIEIAPDIFRPANEKEVKKTGVKLWADIHFTKAAAGKARLAFVRIATDAGFMPEQGDLVLVKLAQPLHPFAYQLGPMPDRDTMLALRAKYFTDIALGYDQEPVQTARFR